MKILILGGTGFLGGHLVETALGRGHDLTLFHRGVTNPGLFPDVRAIHGDRDGGLDAMGDKSFDAVIDTCGYVPRVVRAAVDRFRDQVTTYAFVSSISVYEPRGRETLDESVPPQALGDPRCEDIGGGNYGPLKAACEEEVVSGFGDRALVVRPGLIVGPRDTTDRFTYWIRRLAHGGPVLVPPAATPVQFIDARDLADFLLDLVEASWGGLYNATGPGSGMTFGALLERAAEALGTRPEPVEVSDAFLIENDVSPFQDLPFWVPPDCQAFTRVSSDRAQEAGLTARPPQQTITDTRAWDLERGEPDLEAGLTPSREAALLSTWDSGDS